MPLLFSYGTLQEEAVQVAVFGRVVGGTPDELVGFEKIPFRIDDPEFLTVSEASEFPIVRHSGNNADRVVGTVLELSDAELGWADAYEPDGYTRTVVGLASGKRAWVYAGTPKPTDGPP